MNNLTIILGALAVVILTVNLSMGDLSSEWAQFKLDHGKEYENGNLELLKKSTYALNRKFVDEFKHTEQSKYFDVKLNHLADMSNFEVMKMNGFRAANRQVGRPRNTPEGHKFLQDILDDDSIEVPDEVDWRKTPGIVSRVKDQGTHCGSCWAFASTGALEGQEGKRKISRNNQDGSDLIELSEQNLVDCVENDIGCGGGIMEDAFNWIKTEGGIEDESSYPYEAVTGHCRFKKNKSVMTDSGAAILPSGDEKKLKEVVAKFGPVSVAIDASDIGFHFYTKGVYMNEDCKKDEQRLNHGVLVVGYGTDKEAGDYWIIKNSWGPQWGDHGYIRMARNRDNMCGVATMATIPTF